MTKYSSVTTAMENAAKNYVQNAGMFLSRGDKVFESTEMGTFWIGNDITVSFDTTQIDLVKDNLIKIDSFVVENLTVVFTSKPSLEISNKSNKLIDVSSTELPAWITRLPTTQGFIFASVASEKYYYESSSWLQAENKCRIELAKQIFIEIQQLGKYNHTEGQSIKKEEVKAILKNISVEARWVDVEKEIYYVLMKMPI